MSSAAALPPAPSPSASSVATAAGAASAAMTETASSSATSSRGTAGASSPPAPSTASSVFSAPAWWPPFGRRTAAPATVTPSGAMATMIAPRGGGGGPGVSNRQHTEPPGAAGSRDAAGVPRRQLNPTLPSLRQNSANNTENSNNNKSSRDVAAAAAATTAGEGDRSNVAEARAALEASMANILDRELVPRAQALHAGERVITRQQADVARATASLRQTNSQLSRVVEDTSWKLRELGHLQNWTEMMERRFLTVEETLRLVRGDGDGSDGEKESCSSCRCSECCSDCGRSSWDGSDAGDERAGGSADDRRDTSTGKAGESSAGFCPDTDSADPPASSQAGPSSSGGVSGPSTTPATREAGVLPLAQASVPGGASQASSPSVNVLDVDPSQVPLPAETDSLFEHDSMATAARPV